MPKSSRKPKLTKQKAHCFFAFSFGEPQAQLFLECLRFVFEPQIQVVATPEGLKSGASQLKAITALTRDCMFGVVLLDGLRPNVVFEYGLMRGAGRAVLLFKEGGATVDIPHLAGTSTTVGKEERSILLNCDVQFSDVKDEHETGWSRFKFLETARLIWQQYEANKDVIKDYIKIREPKLWP